MRNFDLFVHNIAEQTSAYDPTKCIDSELYMESLIKMAEALNRKKRLRQKKHMKIFRTPKPLHF